MSNTVRVLIVPNSGNERALEAARGLEQWLTERGHEPRLETSDAEAAGLAARGVAANEIGAHDFAVALGGDGTILKAVHLLGPVETPVLGVNLGRLGFLCAVSGEDLTSAVEAVVEGRAVTEERCTLDVSVVVGGRDAGGHRALNEIFIGRGPGGRAVELEIDVDGSRLQRLVCDGLIVATPTGSTAYAMSAGGPILAPRLRAMALVPVGPHTLASRPIVLDADSRVTVTFPDASRAGACVTVDGEALPCRAPLGRAEVSLGAHDVSLVRIAGDDFYSSVRRTFLGG